MKFDRWIPVESSSLKQVRYKNGHIDVEFKTTGKRFRYYGVPLATFNDLLNASSVGKYFLKNIRDKFSSSNIEVNEIDNNADLVSTFQITPGHFHNVVVTQLGLGLNYKEVKHLAKFGCDQIKQGIAYLKELDKEDLVELAQSTNVNVLRVLSLRDDLPELVKKKLLDSKDSEVLDTISKKDNLPKSILQQISVGKL